MLQLAGEVPGLNGAYSINAPLPFFWQQATQGRADLRLECLGPKFPNRETADTLRYSLAALLSRQNFGRIHGFQVQIDQSKPLAPDLPHAGQLHPVTILRESVLDPNAGGLEEYLEGNAETGVVKAVIKCSAQKLNPAVLADVSNKADLAVGGWRTLEWSPRLTSAGFYIATLRGLQVARI